MFELFQINWKSMFFLIGTSETYSVQQNAMETRFILLYLFAPHPISVTERHLSKSNKKFFRGINDRWNTARCSGIIQ